VKAVVDAAGHPVATVTTSPVADVVIVELSSPTTCTVRALKLAEARDLARALLGAALLLEAAAREDTHTTTVSGAAEHARRLAEDEPIVRGGAS